MNIIYKEFLKRPPHLCQVSNLSIGNVFFFFKFFMHDKGIVKKSDSLSVMTPADLLSIPQLNG